YLLPRQDIRIVSLPGTLDRVELGALLLPRRFSGRLLLLGRHLVPLSLGGGALRLEFGGLGGALVCHVVSLTYELDQREILDFFLARGRERCLLLIRCHRGPLRLRCLIVGLVLRLLCWRHRGLTRRNVGFVIRRLRRHQR